MNGALMDIFAYDPITGIVFWRRDVGQRARVGREAGSIWTSPQGKSYRIIRYGRKAYAAHRLAWFPHTGAWPSAGVDHKASDGLNNRWTNLREATPAQNAQNALTRRDSGTGLKGVSFHKATGKYVARMQAAGRRHSLGLFDTPEAASEAYSAAAAGAHGAYFNPGART